MPAHLLLALTVGLCAQGPLQGPREYRVRIDAADGSSFTGKASLPTSIVVKTKYGEVTVETASIVSLSRTPEGKWVVILSDANKVVGDCTLGPIPLRTAGGMISIGAEDLRDLAFQQEPASQIPRPQTAVAPSETAPPEPAPKGPAFPGVDYRKTPEKDVNRIPYAPAILLSTRKHIALLDHPEEECIFYEIATGTITRAKTESRPTNLVEKNGKIYVANSGTNSLSIFDARTLQPKGRVALGASPIWLTAPARGNVLYFASPENLAGVQAVDTTKDILIGPLISKSGKGGITGSHLAYVCASPDNRLLITQDGMGSPGCIPDVYLLDGLRFVRLWQLGVGLHADHPGPFQADPAGRRLYCGYRVYSSDMRRSIGNPPCAITVPHPTLKLVFGAKQGIYWCSTSETLVLLDEDKLTVLKEVSLGDTIWNILPSDKTIFVVGPKTLYPIDLENILPAGSGRIVAKEPLDIAREIDPDNIRKASELTQSGLKDLETRRFDDARRNFDAAAAIDPFSDGRVGRAMLLVREHKYAEAVDVITEFLCYPFRNTEAFPLLHNQMSIAYIRLNQMDKAVEACQLGLQLEPDNADLHKNLGSAYTSLGEENKAYLHLAKALKIDPKLPDVMTMRNDLATKIHKDTTSTCPTCKGAGKAEAIIEESNASRRKIVKTCTVCTGGGKVWKRPCEDCMGTGRKGVNAFCEPCFGRGVVLEATAR